MNAPLPVWIEKLLGIETGPGEGAVWSLDYSWPWPPWVTVLFALIAVAFVIGTYLRESGRAPVPFRMGLAAIRLLVIALVLAMITQFGLTIHRTGLPYLPVVVDDTLSMTIVDRYDDSTSARIRQQLPALTAEDRSRWRLAQTLLTQQEGALLRALARRYRLRLYYVTGAQRSQATGVEEMVGQLESRRPEGEETRLGDAVRAVLDDLRGTTPAAIVLLTDGISTAGPPLAQAATEAQRRGVPLFLVGVGNDRPVRDLKLTDLLVEEVVFVKDVVSFDARLTASGLEGRQVQVTLRQEGRDEILARTTATIGRDGQSQRVRLTYRPEEPGEFPFIMEVEHLEEEPDANNNRQKRTVRVSDQQIQVLLVQAYPSFEFQYLWNMLTRDSTIQVHAVLQEADVEMVLGDAAGEDAKQALWSFPLRRDELFDYDVIILGDADPALLTSTMMQNLADFVDKPGQGGALVFLAGPRYMPAAYRGTPLERLLPVQLAGLRVPDPDQPITEGFPVQPTDLGLASPPLQMGETRADTQTVWENLPPLYWMIEAPKLKPAARVLAVNPARLGPEGEPLPVIVMQYLGAGKVLFHATDETYRWRFRAGDVFFARYWVQTLRYLSRSKLLHGDRPAVLTADRREYTRGQSVRLRLRFGDERTAPASDQGVEVVLEHEGHRTRRIRLARTPASRGVFEGVLTQPEVGSYHAWVAVPAIEGGAPAVDFTVVAPPGEFERVEMDAAVLRRAAQTSNGRYYTVLDAPRIAGDLPRGQQVPVETLPARPLWNRWPLLALLLALLALEWLLRKTAGMV